MEFRNKEINRNGNIPAKLDNHLCKNELAPGMKLNFHCFLFQEEFSQPNVKFF